MPIGTYEMNPETDDKSPKTVEQKCTKSSVSVIESSFSSLTLNESPSNPFANGQSNTTLSNIDEPECTKIMDNEENSTLNPFTCSTSAMSHSSTITTATNMTDMETTTTTSSITMNGNNDETCTIEQQTSSKVVTSTSVLVSSSTSSSSSTQIIETVQVLPGINSVSATPFDDAILRNELNSDQLFSSTLSNETIDQTMIQSNETLIDPFDPNAPKPDNVFTL